MPMESKINDAKKVHNIAELVTTKEAKEYWLSLIMDALQRLMRNLKYTDCQMIQDYNEKYHEENNNTLMWAEDTSISEVEGKSIGEIMQSYEDWCSENYERPLKKKTLISTLNNFYGLYSRSINIDIQGNGKRTKKRIFMKEDS
jgi:putative DNA primase/helicase